MQYRVGTATVTNGNQTVTGDTGFWEDNVSVGDLFTVVGSTVPYVVGAVVSDTELTLNAAYAGSTASGVQYTVSRSFTDTYSLPYPEPGDIETTTILKAAIIKIDDLIARRTSYTRVVPTTGFNSTVPNGVTVYAMDPGGTLASGTLTMPANPSDGDQVFITSTKTITTLTLAANSGHTLATAFATTLTGGGAGIAWLFNAANNKWIKFI